jgi:beta-fructofuranosidase
MYYKGLYHLFYQYNPKGAVWGNIVWAHSVSTDLIDWTALAPGIYPSRQFDVKGCWSGSATVLPSGVPVVMYTGIDPDEHQVQNVAYPKNLSDPFLREWVKPDYNPIIAPDSGVNASAFRDPTTAWYGPDRHWRLLVGSKVGGKGLAVLYRSRDFRRWVKAHHPLHSGLTGMWECPDFFPVAVHGGGRHYRRGVDTAELHDRALAEEVKYVLKVSLDLTRYEYYTVGTYDHATDRYTPDAGFRDNDYGLRYDYGDFYASKSFYDPAKRRRVLWGWANESDTVPDDRRKGWAGIQVSCSVVRPSTEPLYIVYSIVVKPAPLMIYIYTDVYTYGTGRAGDTEEAVAVAAREAADPVAGGGGQGSARQARERQ